jgi:mycothiol synthase
VTVELRPPRDEDAAPAADLESSSSPRPVTADEVRRAWTAPGTEARVALRGSVVAGYAIVEQEGDEDVQLWIELHARDPEAAASLLEWARGRASELAPAHAPLLAGVWSTDAITRAALEEAGFGLRRHTNVMGMELDAEPAPPSWPPGIAVRPYEDADAEAVYESALEAFLDTWEPLKLTFEQWLHWHPDRELWFLAVADHELVGVVLCRREEFDDSIGWINVLGVRSSWRRHGLGAALLQHALGELRRAGCRRVELGVDAPTRTGAERLYERAGLQVLHRYDLYEHSG